MLLTLSGYAEALVKSKYTNTNDVSQINNYLQYSDKFSSSGQPTKEQFNALSKAKFKYIIYLAYSDNSTAIEHEDRLVSQLNMTYIQLAVDFKNPKPTDFETVATVLKKTANAKTLLHCQVNFRASAFSFLYRVIYQDVPVKIAKQAMDKVWEPNPIWFKFMQKVMRQHHRTLKCDSCDWGSNEFLDDAK